MADEAKKIIVDDDWKAEAKREKERLTTQAEKPPPLPPPSVAEVINIVVMQAMAGLGMMAGPSGERIPADLELAKHYIDMLQVIEEKTRGNLTPDEKQLLDQVLYETRMIFVQVSSGGPVPPPGPGPAI